MKKKILEKYFRKSRGFRQDCVIAYME